MQASQASLEQRLEAVEDRLAIRDLVARYVFAADDRDVTALTGLFTETGVFRSVDGAMSATGRTAIADQFKARFSMMGVSNHITHDHVITLEGGGRASGIVSSHAELWRNDTATIAAIRYADRYEKGRDSRWRFAERTLAFLYYLPVKDYAAALGRLDRNRAARPSVRGVDRAGRRRSPHPLRH